jgi:tRNA1(Val) A37 N6-methylase TrmN6
MKGKGAIEDGGHLAHVIRTNALSSHISSLRALLELEQRKPVDQRITQAKGVICERRTVGGKPRFFYRLEY